MVQEKAALLAAITKHHDQHADDLCWLDDNELYAAAGLPPRDNSVGDPEAMLKNCRRFIATRCSGGTWRSYAELEQLLAEAAEELRQHNADYHHRTSEEFIAKLAAYTGEQNRISAEDVHLLVGVSRGRSPSTN